MKARTISKIAAALAAAALWCGCTDDTSRLKPEIGLGDEQTVTISMDFKLEGRPCNSIAGPPLPSGTKGDVDEDLIEDINIYVAGENGEIIYRGYHKSVTGVEVDAYDNCIYTVYAIANAGKEIVADSAEEIEALEHSIADISGISSSSGGVLMSGKTDPQKVSGNTSVTIFLTRCVAKVTLRADYSRLNEDVEITVKSVKLKNIPSNMKIFSSNRIKTSSGSINGGEVYGPTSTDLERGIDFFQFENLQGTLQPENTSQQEKQWPLGSIYSKICSYVELEATYSSPRKYGDISYRFYLGENMLTNYDVKRNTQMNVVVNFINDGAVEENTWRVDNSEIMDFVTAIELAPQELTFTQFGETKTATATIYPASAYNKALEWSSSNEEVAQTDNNGNITSIGNGECTITATSTDGSNSKGSCKVIVDVDETLPPEPDPELELQFRESSLEMYDKQEYTLLFTQTTEEIQGITATSSNPDIVKITGIESSGIKIEALEAGTATIVAGYGGKEQASCSINVEKLKIVPAAENIVMYNHFYEDIEYTVLPAWAAKEFNITVESGNSSVVCGYEGIANRVIPQFGEWEPLPSNGTMTITLNGREDVAAQIGFCVKPMLALEDEIKVNANLGNRNAIRDLGLDTHPRGEVTFSWVPADGTKYYGNPGEDNVEISALENTITFPIPNSANGLYRLVATVASDDGYSGSDATRGCNIAIYETIYLVGTSKTVDRNRADGEKDTWIYENEIVAKWYSHPNSYMFPNGELPLELPFSYKGVTYTNPHTGVSEEFVFSFENGEQLDMVLGGSQMTYNGTAPRYYLEFFSLEAAGEPYIEGNPATGEPYLYIYSRNFASGFSENAVPDWEKIFKLIYP